MNELELIRSDFETLKHILEVRNNLNKIINLLIDRGENHDASKLESPEREIFAEHLPKLKKTKFGTPEYENLKKEVDEAVAAHHSKNRHHSEHWPNGMADFDLIDLVECLMDWCASAKRNKDGNIHKSLDVNIKKYEIPPMLANILLNTVNRYF